MKKKESVLSFFFESSNKCFTSEIFFRFGQISFNLACTSRKKLCSCVVCLFVCLFVCFFEVSVDHLFDNLESRKRNYYFGKSVEKVWNFGSRICTNLDSSLSFGQVALASCLPWVISCSS